jgi:hypothetical protein
MDDEATISAIKSELLKGGYHLLGPHQPSSLEHGWFAPIAPVGSQSGAAPFGWGETKLEAAKAALNVWRDQIRSRSETAR